MVICEIICDSSNKILIKLQTRTEHVNALLNAYYYK